MENLSSTWRRRFVDALLTRERATRVRLSQTLLAMALAGLGVVGVHYVHWVGIAPAGPIWWWTGFTVSAMLAFYVLIRSGRTRRLPDPSLTMAQMLVGILSTAVAYALIGASRGGAFTLLMVIFMFGVFELDARRMTALTVFAIAAMGGAMLLMAHLDPAVYRPEVEFGHFLMISTMLPTGAVLASRLSRLRARLVEQKALLGQAVARNQELATRDELTGLPNRRSMNQLLEQERMRSQRTGHRFCLAVLDIDHFKRINDEHGHAVGDEVLRRFADAVQAGLRTTDVLARWGGEEFVLAMPETHLPAAVGGIERALQRVQALRVAGRHGAVVEVTVSSGLAEHGVGEETAAVMARADAALYAAKAGGRNRVVIA